MKRLAELLKARRKTDGMNQDELARVVGVHANTVSRAERGESLNRNNVARFAAFLGVDVDDLLDESREMPAGGDAGQSIPLSRFAKGRLKVWAEARGTTAGEWVSAFVDWMDEQSEDFQNYIVGAVGRHSGTANAARPTIDMEGVAEYVIPPAPPAGSYPAPARTDEQRRQIAGVKKAVDDKTPRRGGTGGPP
jgi:transcriptional regulator with XRE-family HTH domain